jgi:lipoprotein-releasing system permease protein
VEKPKAKTNRNPIFRIAFVHLVSKKRQTIVAMLGVMFGITVFIFQAGLITGLQIYMLDKIVNNQAHIHIYNEPDKHPPSLLSKLPAHNQDWIMVRNQKQKDAQKRLKDGAGLIKLIEAHHLVMGIAPNVNTQGILRSGFKETPANLNGIVIDKENQLFNLNKEVIAGDIFQLKTINNGIILGIGVAAKIGSEVGDILTLATTNAIVDVKVIAITQSGITSVDDNRAYINIRLAQNLLNADRTYITDLNIKLIDVDAADLLADQLQQSLGYKAQSWKEANAGIFGVFQIQNMATGLVIFSILVVAGFGIFNILMMMIYEKMTDIAILKSIGFRNADIRNLFMIEALIIGIVGGILGLGMGYVASSLASTIKVQLRGLVTLDHLIINFDPLFYAAGFAFALVSTALAGYFPARKASKIDPVEIIRGK